MNLDPSHSSAMAAVFERQRAAFARERYPELGVRLDRLRRMIDMLIVNQDRVVAAQQQDFVGKGDVLARLGEIVGPLGAVRHIVDSVEDWMAADPVPLPADFEAIGMRAEVCYQPLGVVGVISPWNGPIILSCLPLAGILAAGNRAMIKMSEFTPALADLFAGMVASHFDETEVAVVTGGADVAARFTELPFDHLLYTGSSRVAKQVMRAAAENLVPVTLELGGKSPVVVSRSADLATTIPRLAYGKTMHAGQICVAPDYLLVPSEQVETIAEGILASVRAMFPDIASNGDYGPIINRQRFDRLTEMVDDARARDCRVLAAADLPDVDVPGTPLRFPLHIILDAPEAALVMGEEIFGPILPIIGYDQFEEALAYINRHERPLAAYYFGREEAELDSFQREVIAGGMVVNDVVCQIFHEQLPFGGVGSSGMGRYRGREGFRTFSNALTVLIQTNRDEITGSLRPPYAEGIRAFIDQQLGVQ